MINSIKKISEGKYVLNGSVLIYNFDYADDGLSYSIDFDEENISKDQAEELSKEFISEALESLKK